MRARFVVAGIAGIAGLAACFSGSSGGSAPDASFELDSSIDGFGEDVTMQEAAVDAADAADATAESASPESGAHPDAAGPGDAAAPTDAPGDGPVFGDAGDGGGSAIRVGNMAAGAGAVDFCVAGAGSGFAGPYMLGQGVGSGIPYQAMSEYAALLPESSFTVRVVAAGSTSCATGLVADVTAGPSTDANPTTVVLAGGAGADAGAPLGLQVFTDDSPSTSPPNNRTRFRVIHEAPGLGPVTFQIGASPYVIPVQTGVPYGATFAASTQTTGAVAPDAQGYVEPNMGADQVELVLGGVETMSFYLSAATYPTATDSMTSFLVGVQGSAANPLGFVACDELAAPTGHLAGCTLESSPPQRVPVRVLHASPDQGAIDTCVQVGTLPYTSGLLATAGVSSGVSFLQLTGDLTPIPAGTDLSVAFALVGQTCGTSAFTSVGTALFYQELTVALSESSLPPSTQYQSHIADTGLAVNANAAILTVTNLAGAGGPSYDFYDTENGMSEMQIGGGPIPPYNIVNASLSPDTYAFRVVADATMTTVYMKSPITLAAGQNYLFGWFPANVPSPGSLVQCPVGARAATTLTTCSD